MLLVQQQQWAFPFRFRLLRRMILLLNRTQNTPLLPVVVLLRPRGNILLVWHRVDVDADADVAVVDVVADTIWLLAVLVGAALLPLTRPRIVPLLIDLQNAMERRWC